MNKKKIILFSAILSSVFTLMVLVALRNEIGIDEYLIAIPIFLILFFLIGIPTVNYFGKQYYNAKKVEKKIADNNTKWEELLSDSDNDINEN
ncbi:MAG: hypothetical protein LBC86_01680 [Oscillospiraceae bacterium]|jgi:hypothetical protein|nr:hypothetical protein [Oscillospiraceae bacterium]